jgi:hypothetical protein
MKVKLIKNTEKEEMRPLLIVGFSQIGITARINPKTFNFNA